MANEAEILGKALVMSELKRNGQIGYTKTTWETMFDTEGIKVSFNVNAEQGIGFYEANTTSVLWRAFDNGDTCKVVLDGVEYICPAEVDETSVAIGNKEGAADGPPFLIRAYNLHTETPTLELLVMSVEPEHSLALYRQTETTIPIKPEYLPGVCLPVVELSTAIADSATFTDEENAKLTAAFETGMPVVLKTALQSNGGGISAESFIGVAYRAISDGVMMFVLPFSQTFLLVSVDGLSWQCAVE